MDLQNITQLAAPSLDRAASFSDNYLEKFFVDFEERGGIELKEVDYTVAEEKRGN